MTYQALLAATQNHKSPLTYRAEQHFYYDAMDKILAHPPGPNDAVVAILEAETGVGKPAGYLGVLGLDAAINGRQSIVSTFTRDLRDQIVEKEAPRIVHAIKAMTGKTIRIERWLGQNSFISISKVADEIIRLTNLGSSSQDINALRQWSIFAVNTSPLIEDAEDAGLVLPFPVVAEDICVDSSCPKAEKAPYIRARDIAVDADILIVTHALTALDALTGGDIISKRRDGRTLVLDEAHKLPDACDGILVYRQVFRPNIASGSNPSAAQQAGQAIQQEAYRLLIASGQKQIVIDAQNPNHATLLRLCTAAIGMPEYDGIREIVKAAGKPNGIVKALISRSPTSDYPALTASSISPVRVVKRFFKARMTPSGVNQRYYDHVIFTGATLDPHLVQEMNLLLVAAPSLSYHGANAISPSNFGHQDYVLTIRRNVPDPMIDVLHQQTNETYRKVNPAFYDHVENVINEAHMAALQNGALASGAVNAEGEVIPDHQSHRTLVLVPSFDDIGEIELRMIASGRMGDHILLHTRGHLLTSLREEFKKPKHSKSILISPSAWEGVDLPGMIQCLVIGRIPFEPPSAIKRHFLSNGLAFVNSNNRAAAKFRQGIGRTLRRPGDRSMVWVADPRFPRPINLSRAMGLSNLGLTTRLPASIIPRRFQGQLGAARIVGLNGI